MLFMQAMEKQSSQDDRLSKYMIGMIYGKQFLITYLEYKSFLITLSFYSIEWPKSFLNPL